MIASCSRSYHCQCRNDLKSSPPNKCLTRRDLKYIWHRSWSAPSNQYSHPATRNHHEIWIRLWNAWVMIDHSQAQASTYWGIIRFLTRRVKIKRMKNTQRIITRMTLRRTLRKMKMMNLRWWGRRASHRNYLKELHHNCNKSIGMNLINKCSSTSRF